MAKPRKAFLGDIILCGDWLDHCIVPELFISDSGLSVFCPESILASSSRLCASFAALCSAQHSLPYQSWSDDSFVQFVLQLNRALLISDYPR